MSGAGGRGEMEAFMHAVELGGFSAAARKLGLTPSGLSRLVSRLEARLGVRLLNRTTRKLAPTTEGAVFYERCRRIVADIEEAENEVSRSRDRPRGRVRVTAGVAIGTHLLVPALPRFLERYPEIEVELYVEDRTVDLIKEAIDLGLRTGPLRDSSLVAHKLCDLDRVVCASPGYLARHGVPRTLDDLAAHSCLTQPGVPSSSRWSFDTPAGVSEVVLTGRVLANNAECLLRLAAAGVGIIRMNEAAVAGDIRKGTLVPILTDARDADRTQLHIVYPPGRQRSPQVAAMLDFLTEAFGHTPWRSALPKAKRRR